ncbi:MAG: M24 family metallopeptidase [Planctomycetaceae bacterium]
MSLTINQGAQHFSSGEFEITDPARYEDVDFKQQRMAEFLRERQYDAALLQTAASFAWLTSGAVPPQLRNGAPAALFVTPEARLLVANNIDAPQLFDKYLGGLGFQLKQRPWHEDRRVLLEDLCRGRKTASDLAGYGTDESAALAELRLPLTPFECERLRQLGGLVAHAVEATARHIEAGQSEAEIAGHLAHRLIRHEVEPVWLRAAADGRAAAYRHWSYGDGRLSQWCLVGAMGSRWGLCCAAMRTVVLGSPPGEVVSAFQQAALLEATGIYFSRASSSLVDVWQKVRRIYEKIGIPNEWQFDDQAHVIGYETNEATLVSSGEFVLRPRTAVHWHPSVGGVQTGDTILVGEARAELLTRPAEWPLLHTTVKGEPVLLPDLLVREPMAGGTDAI